MCVHYLLCGVQSGEKREEKEGQKKWTSLGSNRESSHTSTLLVAGARRANPEQKFRESDLSCQTAERTALAAKTPAFGPDRQGGLLQQ